MTQATDTSIALAMGYRERLAGRALTPAAAKLYSQYCRLREHQEGLANWRENEPAQRLDEAVHLIDAALIEREGRTEQEWREGLRRAGELLEWLSHPEIRPAGVPTGLLAAAAYQLAGYPARSAGLLRDFTTETAASTAVRYLLEADFAELTEALVEFWGESPDGRGAALPWGDPGSLAAALDRWITQETMSALGVVVSQMRWGDEPRSDAAVGKLSAVSRLLLHGEDPYSWFLARLCAMVADVHFGSSLRRHLTGLASGMSEGGKGILERYVRQSYQGQRILAWPSQIRGIERLTSGQSFALCAPTGSGKTAVAELAILQSLFPGSGVGEHVSQQTAPGLVTVYLVPSRALATEVEYKLSRLVERLAEPRVVVTGLYGGTDWGPTDAWLTREDHVILICTYEKGEALLRFLGTSFVDRISLVVIDEAHLIQFDGNNLALQQAESRPLRLEVLCARLLAHASNSRALALAAVAGGLEQQLAAWIAAQESAVPVSVDYRSTRQLIGCLECLPNRRFRIGYDLLDGTPLEFEEDGSARSPFIPDPLPPYPETVYWNKTGVETRLRPYLFWASMHLASERDAGHQRAVLISVPQQIGGYADDFLSLLQSDWREVELPPFFRPPRDAGKQELWDQCLQSCVDYFGADSREYQLLQRGVVMHHGSMPGRMARLLVELIQQRVVNLVIATSTLTEGLNLPFETVLISSLRRGLQDLSPREFGNLAGRAGRPGFTTEGRTLVLLPSPLPGDSVRQAEGLDRMRNRYSDIVRALQRDDRGSPARSPLAQLLRLLRHHWATVSGTDDDLAYLDWLEETAPLVPDTGEGEEAVESLDALDSILLAAIVELEELTGAPLTLDEVESELRRIWSRCYARYAAEEQASLERIFLRRGAALVDRIYPTSEERRRLYRTSLPPRSGARLLSVYPTLRSHLETGTDYSRWDIEHRYAFVESAVGLLSAVARFKPGDTVGRREVDWRDILRWWLDPTHAPRIPSPRQRSEWHKYVRQYFQYRFNWGLGNVIGLAVDESYAGEPRAPTIENWPDTGLPWVVLWLKELIVWGTLEPVAACLLARAVAATRPEAESRAREYYDDHTFEDADELLNASVIRMWTDSLISALRDTGPTPPRQMPVSLLRDFRGAPRELWRVLPVEVDDSIRWTDPAGFPLARSPRPQHWRSEWLHSWDFQLNHATRTVSPSKYLRFDARPG